MSEPAKTPYWQLWFLSQSLICFGLFLFFSNQHGTLEYLGVAMFMGAIVTIPTGLLAIGVGTIIFLVTKEILKRRRTTFRVGVAWLVVPTAICLSLLLIAGVCQSLPNNRLKFVGRGFAPKSARDIRVSGYDGFLNGLWMAKFKVGSTEFEKFATEAQLEPTRSENLHWVTNRLPTSFQVNLQTGSSYKRSFLDERKRERASLCAYFDPETGIALVLREYHD